MHEEADKVAGSADTVAVGIAFHIGKRAARELGDFIHEIIKVHPIHAKVIEKLIFVPDGESAASNPDAEPFENSANDYRVGGPAIKRPCEPANGFPAPCRPEGTDRTV